MQILTIHGSKGLEFPVVVLTGINAAPVARGHVIWPPGSPPEVTLYKDFQTPGFGAAQLDVAGHLLPSLWGFGTSTALAVGLVRVPVSTNPLAMD